MNAPLAGVTPAYIIKKPNQLTRGKQHIVVYDTHANRNIFAESCSNCFVVHGQMTHKEWVDMLYDFTHGFITTLIISKLRINGWRLYMDPASVDVFFTYDANQCDLLQAKARIRKP